MFRYTIITYNYNNAENIIQHIGSLINIDYNDYEIIIIDDNSHDNSLDLLQEKLTIRNNIRTISCKYHRGVFNCLNIGIEMANGKYIMFTNSNYTINNNIFRTIDYNINEKAISPEMIEYKIVKKSNHEYMNLIISNDIVKNLGFFDTFEYYSDWEYKYRIRKIYTPFYIDIVLGQQIKYEEDDDIDFRNNIYFKNKFSCLKDRLYIPKDNRLKLMSFELEPYIYSNEDVIVSEDNNEIFCKQFFRIFKKSVYKICNIDNKIKITISNMNNKIMPIKDGNIIFDIGIYKINYELEDNKVITFEPIYFIDTN